MAKDPLKEEVSLSVDLTESGVTARAKSRTIAAIDRLCGNAADWVNLKLERGLGRERALLEGEKEIIDAVTKQAVQRLGMDRDFANRALENHFGKLFTAQANKDAVAQEAVKLLEHQPPSAQETGSGEDTLREEFIGRFEHYAEGATSEELRRRWARVLSAEIRRPGTFNLKALRVVDELGADTAALFERLCASRLDDVLSKALVGDLSFPETAALTTAGLLIDPGLAGQVRRSSVAADNTGVEWSFFVFGTRALALKKDVPIPSPDSTLLAGREGAELPVYVLTDVGKSISSILENQERTAIDRLAHKMKVKLPTAELRYYERVGNEWIVRAVY